MTRGSGRRIRDRRVGWSVLEVGLASYIWVGCALESEESGFGTRTAALAVAGPWQIPPEVRAAGDAAEVPYVGGGVWQGEEGCSGQLTEHAANLRELLLWAFPQIAFISDYACRPIGTSEARTSVHGVGRALDLHIPMVAGGEADNELGDPVGNWLVENAQVLGVQYVIWDGWQWRSNLEPGAKDGPYGGSNPHRDHLHVEVTVTPRPAPASDPALDEPCSALPREGGSIDESGPCVARYGPDEYWRLDESAGYGGSLYWTNAFTSDTPSNWARYTLWFEEAGDYLVRAHVPAGYGCFDAVRYEIRHAEEHATVIVDQAASPGWVSVGTYFFTADQEQWVDVFDDTHFEVDSERHVVVDALRVDRVKRLAAEVPRAREASPEQRSPTSFASEVRATEASVDGDEPASASPAVSGSTPAEGTEAAGSSGNRSTCTVSPGRCRAAPGTLGLGVLLAWLLRRMRRETSRGGPSSKHACWVAQRRSWSTVAWPQSSPRPRGGSANWTKGG